MKLRQITQMLLGLSIATANASATDAMHRNADVSNTIDVTGVQKYMVYPHLQKGFEALEKGLADRAIKEFQQANSLAPNSVSVALYLAEAHRRFGQLNKAEAVLSLMMMKFSENKALASAIKNIRTELAAKSNLENHTPTSQQKTTKFPNHASRRNYYKQKR
jgi:thioredoxin-like negative regulator of GroEL